MLSHDGLDFASMDKIADVTDSGSSFRLNLCSTYLLAACYACFLEQGVMRTMDASNRAVLKCLTVCICELQTTSLLNPYNKLDRTFSVFQSLCGSYAVFGWGFDATFVVLHPCTPCAFYSILRNIRRSHFRFNTSPSRSQVDGTKFRRQLQGQIISQLAAVNIWANQRSYLSHTNKLLYHNCTGRIALPLLPSTSSTITADRYVSTQSISVAVVP